MFYQVNFSDESKADLKEAIHYYSVISDELSKKFILEISETIETIGVNPKHFQKRYRSVHIIFTKVFSFGVHYITEGNVIYVQRIIHRKRLYK